jgi:hypothetical protein
MRINLTDLKQPDLKLHGIYRGVVEDNSDPTFAGKCRVRVFGVHSSSPVGSSYEGIATAELPWAEPVLGLIEGSISGYGLFSVPLQGSHVFVFFENGNHMMPRYFGSAPGTVATAATVPVEGAVPVAFVDPDGVYPDATGVEFNSGEGTYPHNIVLKTHGGHIIELDSTPEAKRIKIYHSSGTNTVIDNEGIVTITRVSDYIDNITGDSTVTIGGDGSIDVTGDWNVTVGGQANITVTGDWNVTVGGQANITVTGKCTVTGNPINLN